MTYLTVSRTQQLYVGVVILVLIPVIIAVVCQPSIQGAYLQQFVRPGLESEFGFRGGRVQLSKEAGGMEAFAVVQVVKDGALWRAGVRPGDLPVGDEHGFESGFYLDLLRVRSGERVEVSMVAAKEAVSPRFWRSVRIEPRVAR